MTKKLATVLVPSIEGKIMTIRGHRVILDSDLAEFYGVPTKRLNEQVTRNIGKFPEEFMFQITKEEASDLRSQIATLQSGSHFRYFPRVFTEHGVLMAANVLRSDRAVTMSVELVKAFVRMRSALIAVPELAKKVLAIEEKLSGFQEQFDLFQELVLPLITVHQTEPKNKIGFDPAGPKKKE